MPTESAPSPSQSPVAGNRNHAPARTEREYDISRSRSEQFLRRNAPEDDR